jgi:histidinol-phosphatase
MNQDTYDRSILTFAHELADISAPILLDAIRTSPTTELKSDNSYVTETDRAIETALREEIVTKFPGHGIVGEEFGNINEDAEYVWVLDPIDGTAAFVAGVPVFGTLIGVARNRKPHVGIVDHPVTGERWSGIAGKFADKNGEPVQVRKSNDIGEALMTCSNPDPFSLSEMASFESLRKQVRYTLYGGSCYSYALLATGRTDLAIDAGLDAFDVFAPAALILGAGGDVSDWHGQPLDLGFEGRILASADKALHDQALAKLAWTS